MRVSVALVLLLAIGCSRPVAKPVARRVEPKSVDAVWPWPGAARQELGKGFSRWFSRSASGNELELLEFDFAANPKLRFELYDQDEDGDNLADYYPRGVGQVVRDLNARGPGQVLAAWNGLFFAYDFRAGGERGMARHIGPVILNGQVRHNVGNHRWTFGVKNGRFKVMHLPDRATMAREFDYGAVGAQCLIREGKPLRIQPYPQPDDPPLRQPVPSTPEEAGHIPGVDHMRTSRVSMAWPKDGRKLWLLVVNEPDHELGSKLALKRGEADAGGWTLADLQRFWISFGAANAINSDGGAVTQLTFRRPDGKYEMLPPRIAAPNRRLVFEPDFQGAPAGGTLLTFLVRID